MFFRGESSTFNTNTKSISTDNDNIDYREKLNYYLNEVKHLNDKMSKLQTKIETLQNDNIKYKKKIKQQSKLVYKCKADLSNAECCLDEQREVNKQLEITCNKTTAKLSKSTNQVNLGIKNQKLVSKIRFERKKSNKLKYTIYKKDIEINTLKHENNILKNKNKALNDYRLKYLKLLSSNNLPKHNLQNNLVNTTPNSTINSVRVDKVTNSILISNNINIDKVINVPINTNTNTNTIDSICTQSQSTILFGFIQKSKDDLSFKTINGNTYPILNPSYLHLINNLPCKVSLINNIATILDTYNFTEDIKEPLTNKIHRNKKESNIKTMYSLNEYVGLFNNQKVLLLSSAKCLTYKLGFNKVNLQLDCFNPYEHGIEAFKNKLDKYDVIIVCLDRVPHSCSKFIDNYKRASTTKIEKIYNSTLTRVLGRVYYALQN